MFWVLRPLHLKFNNKLSAFDVCVCSAVCLTIQSLHSHSSSWFCSWKQLIALCTTSVMIEYALIAFDQREISIILCAAYFFFICLLRSSFSLLIWFIFFAFFCCLMALVVLTDNRFDNDNEIVHWHCIRRHSLSMHFFLLLLFVAFSMVPWMVAITEFIYHSIMRRFESKRPFDHFYSLPLKCVFFFHQLSLVRSYNFCLSSFILSDYISIKHTKWQYDSITIMIAL